MEDLADIANAITEVEKSVLGEDRLIRIDYNGKHYFNERTFDTVKAKRLSNGTEEFYSAKHTPQEARIKVVRDMFRLGRFRRADAYELIWLEAKEISQDPPEYMGFALVLYYKIIQEGEKCILKI